MACATCLLFTGRAAAHTSDLTLFSCSFPRVGLAPYFQIRFLKEKTEEELFLPDNFRLKVSELSISLNVCASVWFTRDFRSLRTKDKAQYVFSLGLVGT